MFFSCFFHVFRSCVLAHFFFHKNNTIHNTVQCTLYFTACKQFKRMYPSLASLGVHSDAESTSLPNGEFVWSRAQFILGFLCNPSTH